MLRMIDGAENVTTAQVGEKYGWKGLFDSTWGFRALASGEGGAPAPRTGSRSYFVQSSAPGNVRVTQESAEAVVIPTTQRARVTRESAEALVIPTTQRVRVTRVTAEVLVVQTLVNPRAYAQVIG